VLAAEIDGEMAHMEAFGKLHLGQPGEITADTRFYVASTAKMFTASCVHLLVQEGKLDLDDELGEHIPELAKASPGVTIRQMLHHRSGLRDFYEMGVLLGWDLKEPPPRDEIVTLLTRQNGLNFAAGSSASYSNSNYLLLAMLVEELSGMPFPEFANQSLFMPLGMSSTAFAVPDQAETATQASPHVRGQTGFEAQGIRNRLVGAGGAWSTAADLLRFARVFHDEQWSKLAAALCADPGLNASQWLNPQLGDYRAGAMHREIGGVDVFFHPGGYMGAQAILLAAPELDLSVAMVTNRQDIPVQDLSLAVAAVLGLEPDAAGDPPVSDQAPPAMRTLLRGQRHGEIVLLSVQGKRGVFQGLGIDLRLQPSGSDRLAAPAAAFPLEIVVDAASRQVEVQSPGKEALVYAAEAMDPFSAEDAEDCAGVYYSEELGSELELITKGGQLVLQDAGMAISIPPFRALSRDVHVSAGQLMILIEFERGEEGEIVGLKLGTNRAQGVQFIRS
jgi:CubicO group peptidase (beta-lactamase class C family)